eukprot:TRINITY_DN2189_c0_g1_i1.p1 TRINITY_DN2189_c0_g1~~TRINITY_DN2189_c0_g1_i1.p1  ORF type:complete len:516 (-),score=147.71 TRINITY_DN2189_c0_g1_i1:12-1559(-)
MSEFSSPKRAAENEGIGSAKKKKKKISAKKLIPISKQALGASSSSSSSSVAQHAVSHGKKTALSSSTKAPKKGDQSLKKEANSIVEAGKVFSWLIAPHDSDDFFENYWEKKHLVIRRTEPGYFSGIFTKDDIDSMLRESCLKYTVNLDITNYINGQRETLNPVGRAYAPVVWKHYREGCSIRLLNPQAFHEGLWKLLATLQEHFGCFVGANTYLTPSGAQGFSPHYDDVDVFILQTEGSKRWRLYNPPEEADALARNASRNYEQSEIGEPIEEVTLNPGDLLYMPRGTVHQAVSPPGTHSLHVTLSTFQHNAYIDLLEAAVPRALQLASDSSVSFRKGLPRDYMDYMGVAYQDNDDDEKRVAFVAHMRELWDELFEHLPLDSAADQMAIKYHYDALPPYLLPSESVRTLSAIEDDIAELNITREIRLIRAHAIRIVLEEDVLMCHFHTENTKVYHEIEPQAIEFDPSVGPGLEYLLESYNDGYVPIKSIPVETEEQQVDIANALYERNLVEVKPL